MLLPMVIERALRTYLRWDPASLARIASLAGKTVKIELTDWHYVLYFCLEEHGVSIKKNYPGNPDAEIAGTSWALLQKSIAKQNTTTNDILISGDVELAHAIQQVIKNAEIDWEEPLSHLTGDMLAYQLGNMARHLKRWQKQASSQMANNITEYLHEELRLLPPPAELEDFYTAVYELSADVERISARITLLQTTVEEE